MGKLLEEIGRRFVTAIIINKIVHSLVVNENSADIEWFEFRTRGPELSLISFKIQNIIGLLLMVSFKAQNFI